MPQPGDTSLQNKPVECPNLNVQVDGNSKHETQLTKPSCPPYEALMHSSPVAFSSLSIPDGKCVNDDIQPLPSAGLPYPQQNPSYGGSPYPQQNPSYGGPPYPQQNPQYGGPQPPSFGGQQPPPYGNSSATGTYIVPFASNAKGGRVKDVEGFTMRNNFENDDVRRKFIRKVYFTLCVQLSITFGIVCLFTFIPAVEETVREHPWIYYLSYGIFLVLYITLMCCEGVRRKSPLNIILLFVFTLALSYLVGTIASYHQTKTVVIALGITAGVCLAVTLFSMQTKFDFTKCAGVLFVLSMVFFLFGIITIFTFRYNWYVHVVYGALGALLFTMFLAFDTQMIMGGKRYEMDPEEYIYGAMTLYIDVVYIFIFILSLVGDTGN